MLTTIRTWLAAHPVAATYIVGAIFTVTLRVLGSAWWAGFKARHPRVAAVAQIVRGLGLDAPKIEAALRVLLRLPPAAPKVQP